MVLPLEENRSNDSMVLVLPYDAAVRVVPALYRLICQHSKFLNVFTALRLLVIFPLNQTAH